MVIFKHGAPRGTVSSQVESILFEAEAEVMERGTGTGDLISLEGRNVQPCYLQFWLCCEAAAR